ncbi:hypothetical protein [Microbacterium esteraromaticum]|uniref:hypothetical protein n=1 Tax=Microbacterium esteraromaticum TaxID=57043 RepID=UPI0019D36549|nr:hypothetical protein [Microbacterium esteraromaticum]MBN7792779.1 hypothetical protein [Microbacterium esteraromaticum]
MRRRIDIPQARELVLSRHQVLASGYSERQMRSDLDSARLLRLHRGSYVSAQVWDELWWEGRHLLRVLAVHAASPGPGPVFTHTSAAALWGLPLYRVGAAPVQVLVDGQRHSRVIADVIRRDMKVDPADIVEIDGIRVTSPTRTAMDIARTYPFPAAVACADAALRRAAVDGYIVDAEADAAWREDAARLATPGLRGVRQARRALEFADGRADLPGESVSRAHLHTLGFRGFDLQVPVTGSEGQQYWLDFAFPRARCFGEFDGAAKYTEPALRAAPSAQQAVLDEKSREDDVRGVTGWRFARWGHDHIRTADVLGARLAAFGVRPPG